MRFSVGMLAFVGLATLNFTQSEGCFLNKALASSGAISSSAHASDESMWESQWNSYNSSSDVSSGINNSDSTSGDGQDHGNVAYKQCPIWSVKITTGDEAKKECTTGGLEQCEWGKCPHGYIIYDV